MAEAENKGKAEAEVQDPPLKPATAMIEIM